MSVVCGVTHMQRQDSDILFSHLQLKYTKEGAFPQNICVGRAALFLTREEG